MKKEKDTERLATLEEVFDYSTVMTAYSLIRKNIIDHFNGTLSTGKESRVYLAFDSNNNMLAVKIYLITSAEFKRGMRMYLDDYGLKLYSKNFRNAVFYWCEKEYKHLKIAYEANVRVPKPIAYKNNILVLEFLGEEGKPAPLLADCYGIDFDKAYHDIIESIQNLYKAGLIHADLSEYNILYHKEAPYLIDFGQSVKISHPNANYFLLRDIKNINKFFRSRKVPVIEDYELFEKITSY